MGKGIKELSMLKKSRMSNDQNIPFLQPDKYEFSFCNTAHVISPRYYPALKSLEQLEHTYLPRIGRYSMHYFIKRIDCV